MKSKFPYLFLSRRYTGLLLGLTVILFALEFQGAQVPTKCDVSDDCPNALDDYFCDINFHACMSCDPWCHSASARDRRIKCKEYCPSKSTIVDRL